MRRLPQNEHQSRFWNFSIQAVILASAILAGCNGSATGPTAQLGAVTNLTAFSASATAIGLSWTSSPDSSSTDLAQYKINAWANSVLQATVYASKTDRGTVVGNLLGNYVYQLDVTAMAAPGSQKFSNSTTVSIQWAPAKRFVGPYSLQELASNNGAGSGLVFLDQGTGQPQVRSAAFRAVYQQVLDVILDSTSSGGLVLRSADLNPLLVGTTPRHTRFSTVVTDSDVLNIGQNQPPARATYTVDTVLIDTAPVTIGKIFYAISSDSNYVRILVPQSGGSLFAGAAPNRAVNLQLSYQLLPNTPFVKRSGN